MALLHTAELEVAPPGGDAGNAEAWSLRFPVAGDGQGVRAQPVPPDLRGDADPRRQLAAHALQALFLRPEDYVVPATTLRCVPLSAWRGVAVAATVPGTSCALMRVALALEGVTAPDVLFDRERFLEEPAYAYFLSNFNVFTVLADHRGEPSESFLVSTDEAARQVFAVGNARTFGAPARELFAEHWSALRVPAVRAETIDRLRGLRREDLDVLLVVLQLEPDADGVLWPVNPDPPLAGRGGATRRGATLQLGLRVEEIDAVWKRIRTLIGEVDAGALPVF
jgi:hypothetical protein